MGWSAYQQSGKRIPRISFIASPHFYQLPLSNAPLIMCYRHSKKFGSLKNTSRITRWQLVSSAKSYAKWLAKKNPNIDSLEIDQVKLPQAQWKTKKPEDMLTVEEVQCVIQAARNSRDKAIIAMLYDGSNRPIEILRLQWKDLIADSHGYYFITDAKTRKERRIRLTTASIPYIDQWRVEHPDPSPEQYIFCNINATEKGIRPMTIDNVQRMLKLIKNKTGIHKLKASIFRSSRITHDVASGVELPYIMKKNWGTLTTKMIDVYTNLDANYLDEVALRNAGMERTLEFKEQQVYRLEPPVCPICHKVNLLGSKYCAECRHPLTNDAQQEVVNTGDQIRQLLVENPQAQAVFMQLLKELNIQNA